MNHSSKEGAESGPRKKSRLDVLLVERGLAQSREQAQRLIMAGKVRAQGFDLLKPGMKIPTDARLELLAGERYVSRGGIKLEAALEAFGIDPAGRVCADVGASTGGFTDCLLQRAAARVYAIDVGKSQIHAKLRDDPRVVLIEQTNARELSESTLPEKAQLIVMDLSFISLAVVLPAIGQIAAPDAQCVCLVKPQFEAGRAEVSRGKGIVRDPAVHREVLEKVLASAERAGWRPLGLTPSPIAGGSGNREYLLHLRRGDAGETFATPAPQLDINAAIQQALTATQPPPDAQ